MGELQRHRATGTRKGLVPKSSLRKQPKLIEKTAKKHSKPTVEKSSLSESPPMCSTFCLYSLNLSHAGHDAIDGHSMEEEHVGKEYPQTSTIRAGAVDSRF